MKRLSLALGLTILGTISPVFSPELHPQTTDEQTNIRVYQIASGGVVSIRSQASTGSGTIIDRQGLILTSGHVVGRSKVVSITLADGRKLTGQVIASSRQPDLALIRLDNPPPNLSPIPLAPPTKPILVGQRAFAIGDPFGRFAGTLTTGIISRIDASQQLIQTTALLNPGNSGGPLLNSDGELIGLNTAIFEGNDPARPTGVGLAIANDRLRQFLADAQAGKVGINAQDFTLTVNSAPITASFSAQDQVLEDGSFFQAYELSGQAGETITIEMQSRQIDPYMVLFDPNGKQIAEDDDSGGGKNARITIKLPMTGIYTLYVNSYEAGKTGTYTLSLRSGKLLLQQQGQLSKDSPSKAIQFEGMSGQVVQITLISKQFLPRLSLISPDQTTPPSIAVQNDRHSAVMKVRLPVSGTYRVLANSADPQGRGNYEIIIKEIR